MSSNITLGQILTGNEGRDAVHVAIAPCVAKEKLFPGQDVGADGTTAQPHVGIVDPYLKHPVLPEQGFWVCLYPNTVTSLRHEWTHPAFGPQGTTKASEDDVEFSRQWLQRYAERMNSYDLEDNGSEAAYKRLVDGLHSGELYARGTDLHGLYDLDDAEELREHAERVLGIKIDWGRFSFSCSC